MPKPIKEQIADNWFVFCIVAVGAVVMIGGLYFTMHAMLDVSRSLNEFAKPGQRYSLEQHNKYAAEQAERDKEQDQRLDVLESLMK